MTELITDDPYIQLARLVVGVGGMSALAQVVGGERLCTLHYRHPDSHLQTGLRIHRELPPEVIAAVGELLVRPNAEPVVTAGPQSLSLH